MKDLIAKYDEYKIRAVWDITYGTDALTKFGIAILDYDLNQIKLPTPAENAKPIELLSGLSQHFETLKMLSAILVRYAAWLSLPVDLQHNGKPINAEIRKKLAEMQKLIADESENIPRHIAEILATVKFPNYSIQVAKVEIDKKSEKASSLLDINLKSLLNQEDYLGKVVQLANDLNAQKSSLQDISYGMSLQIMRLVPNKELRENVVAHLMPNADKLIKAVNGRLINIAKELISKDPKVIALISSIKEVVAGFNRFPEESDESYLNRLENLKSPVQKNFANLKTIVEVTKALVSELGFRRNDNVLIQEIASFADQLIREQKTKLQYAMDQIEETSKEIKKPLRKFIEKAANDFVGPNAGTPKIILVTYHSSDREILGVPSGDHTGIILCGGGREPLCLSFYGNRRIVKSEKTGLEGMILKALHIPSKVMSGHFRDINTEIDVYEKVEQSTADFVVLECGDDIGFNFDAVYQWAQEQIQNPRDYDFRTSNCAAVGLNALKIGLEGNEKSKEYNEQLEKCKMLGTAVPRQLQKCAEQIEADITERRSKKFAIELANDKENLIPQQNDAFKTEIIAFQTELEVRIRALKQIQKQEIENPLLGKKFNPEELFFLEDVSNAYNLILSNLPPQSESIRDRELYRYRFNEALANLDQAIYTKFDRDLGSKDFYKNVRTEIFRLRKTINTDESKSVYYKLSLELEQILHLSKNEFNSICGEYTNIHQDEIKRRNELIIKQVQQAKNPVKIQENKYALTFNVDRLITAVKIVQGEKNVLNGEYKQIEHALNEIDANRAIPLAQKKQQIKQKLQEMEFNDHLQKHYSQLSQSLIAKHNEITQFLYLESSDAKSTLSDNVPFINLWKSLTTLSPDLVHNYDYLKNKVVSEIANRNATRIPKPWFFQFWKKPAYKEQQAQYAFADILQNKQMAYNEKIKKIKQIIDENMPLNYEVWFNGKAVKERMARFSEIKEKAYLICMFDAFVNGEMDRDSLVKKIEALIGFSKNPSRKEELDKLKDGLNILNVKYRLEEENAKLKVIPIIAPPQAVPGLAPAPEQIPIVPVVSSDIPLHLPTEGLHHKGEHFFEELHRRHHQQHGGGEGIANDSTIKVGGPGQK